MKKQLSEYYYIKNSHHPASTPKLGEFGVTIVELLVVIFIISIFIAFFVPTVLNRAANHARITTTRQKLDQLRKAIVGTPELISNGEYVDTGFKGDMGRLPTSLLELVDTTITPKWNQFAKHGWNGPYIRDFM
jgi:type II secretory pathway pseudopilin PulG